MFKLMINNKEFVSPSYEDFCKDRALWENIVEFSGYQGTGGDWRFIGLTLHDAVIQAQKDNKFNVWHGIYKPYSVPPIGFILIK